MESVTGKNFNTVLNEAYDQLSAQGVTMIGDGYKEIATNQSLFSQYSDLLNEGATADHAAVMGSLMANTNGSILQESSVSGIAPIASLSMPVIRKLWPKFALKEALKTEVAKSPRFIVAYTKPYLFKGDDPANKHYLPYRDSSNLATRVGKSHVYAKTTLTVGKALTIDFDAATGAQSGYTIYSDSAYSVQVGAALEAAGTNSIAKKQPLTSEFLVYFNGASASTRLDITGSVIADVVGLTVGATGVAHVSGTADATAGADNKALVVLYDANHTELYAVGDTVAAGVHYVDADFAGAGQLIVRADLEKGTAFVALVGTSGIVTIDAIVSQEFNEQSWSLGLEIGRKDIDIPVGDHFNAPLGVEMLNDMMALYQIDGTKEVVDIMTNTISQNLDLDVLHFLEKSFLGQPGSVDQFSGYPTASEYSLSFDVRPASGYAGSTKAWREELKPQIDFLAQKIKNNTYLQQGVFNLVGNPLDIQLLTNIDWQFRGGQGGNMDGVDVDYSIGTYVGANSYKVIASPNVPQGQIYLVFIPSSDTQMTYKYYPYTFSTEMGYIDPNRSRLPSIMMTKRQTFAEFLPAIGLIMILNNDGVSQFAKFVTTKTWSAE